MTTVIISFIIGVIVGAPVGVLVGRKNPDKANKLSVVAEKAVEKGIEISTKIKS
jgi:hypothetical protein